MIHIEIVNDQRVMQSLQRAANALQHTGPLMAEIGGLLEANARERFDSKTDPAGHKWAAIADASAAIHRAITGKALSGSLLERSGLLRDSIESHVIDAGAGVEVGPSTPYAAFHEFGTRPRGRKGGGAIPRRGMIFGDVSGQGQNAQVSQVLNQGDTQEVVALVMRHVQAALG
jgi:phage virion morphogenesis protein